MRALALVLTAATGFAGLVYEVTWQKYLAILMGAQSEATAAILAIFLGGLSLGYWLFGRVSARIAAGEGAGARLLATYGVVEVAIGVWAIGFPLLFHLAQGVAARVPFADASLALGFDALLAVVLIGPPTVLMGSTIPLLTQALARDLDDATRIHALVYGFNTVGAFAGALAAGLWLISALGLVGVLQAMAVVNVIAGVAFWLFSRRGVRVVAAAPAPAAADARIEGFLVYAAVAALVGFAMSTLQTVLIRLGGLALGSSHVTFSIVVSVFVLCIALGSFGVSALSRISGRALIANAWLLAIAFGALHLFMADGGYWTHVLRSLFRDDAHALWLFRLVIFVALLLVVGPAVVLSGATLPLLFHHLRHQTGDLGAVAGRLYSWNTVGSVVGAIVGGYLLFFWIDLDGVFRVAVGALAVAAAGITMRVAPRGWIGAAVLVPALVAIALLPEWSTYRLSLGTFRYRQPLPTTFAGPDVYFGERQERTGEKILFYDDDPVASVAVREFAIDGGNRSRAIVTNGKSDGALVGDYPTMALAALLPALFAERVERALVIGWGTGVTVGELAALDSMQSVRVAEISPGVIDAAPLFEHGNLGASGNPKVEIVQADAYRALLRSEGHYDMIISEPSNPWVSGVEMLSSREFLETARDRLNPGGVYTQWFPLYETDDDTVELVLRTLQAVFDDAAIWYTTGPDLLLLGFRDGGADEDDLERALARMQREDYGKALTRAGVRDVAGLLAHEVWPRGVLAKIPLEGPLHTLLHPTLADRAARAFFAGQRGSLPLAAALAPARVGAERSLLRRWLAQQPEDPLIVAVARREAVIRETCRYRPTECVVRLAQWRAEEPNNPAVRVRIDNVMKRPPPGGAIDPREIDNLSLLFREERVQMTPDTALDIARQASELFLSHYVPTAPFRRGSLRLLWEQCASDPALADRCREGREAVERVIGPLDAEAVAVASDAAGQP